MLVDPSVIEVYNLYNSHGDLEVLNGVSLTENARDVVALIESSGTGESTLLRCSNLLGNSQAGDFFDGEAVQWSGALH